MPYAACDGEQKGDGVGKDVNGAALREEHFDSGVKDGLEQGEPGPER